MKVRAKRDSEKDDEEDDKEETKRARSDDDQKDSDEDDEEDEDKKEGLSKKRAKDDEDDESDNEKEDDEKTRTVELCWTTGAGVVRTDENGQQYLEVLSLDPSAVRLDRLNSGRAPLLNSHSQDALDSVLGVVCSAYIDPAKKEGRATVKFSRRPGVDGILDDVRDKIISSTSVGYTVHNWEDITKPGDPMPVRLINDWTPLEISLVAVPADMNSAVRKKQGIQMKIEKKQTQSVDASNVVQAEIKRGQEIRKSVRAAQLPEAFADNLIETRVEVDEARKLIIDELAKQGVNQTRFQTQIDVRAGGLDERETFRKGVEASILNRINPKKNPHQGLSALFEGMSLFDLAKESAKRSHPGYFAPYPGAVMERAFATSSDFPGILANVMNKLLRESFDSAPATYQAFTKQVSARDFKPLYRMQLGEAPALEPLNEHGEFKMGKLSETVESYKIQSYGKRLAVSRELIVNDDLSAFQRIPMLMGRAAADHISDTFYNQFTSDYMMGDGLTLFHEKHNNIAEKSDSISIESLSDMRTKIRLHVGQAGRLLNLTPKILLIPASLETITQQYLSQNYLYGVMKASAEQNINPFAGAFQVIVEPRLDAKSTTTWYGIVDPGMIDTAEIAFLDGQSGPYLDSRQGFEVSGMEWLVRMEYGIAPIEWRAFYKNPGLKRERKVA